ncbi:MAG: nucleotidyltransferase domain-containing protein [Oligoflexales bacterium]|nr:nucleotidyltransferase domain-containing protein [Oligoflexales bacterium]
MSTVDEFGLNISTTEKIKNVFSKHSGVDRAIIYGSRAKKTYKPGSDIDITLEGSQLTLSDQLKIENQIEDLLLPYKVDLSIFHTISNKELIDHIHRVGIVFYQRK